MKRLKFRISPDGSVEIKAEGFTGATCEEATRAYEDSLGKTVSDERTEDYYRDELAKVDQ